MIVDSLILCQTRPLGIARIQAVEISPSFKISSCLKLLTFFAW